MQTEVFPLRIWGQGWAEITNPNPRHRPDAFRMVCYDPACPAVIEGPVRVLPGEHSHIYVGEWVDSAPQAPLPAAPRLDGEIPLPFDS